MPENNRPQGRKTNVTGQSTGAYRRGEGLNTGPVGSSNSNPHSSQQHNSRPGVSRAAKAGGGGGMLIIIILVLFFLLKGGGGGLLSGGESSSPSMGGSVSSGSLSTPAPVSTPSPTNKPSGSGTGSLSPYANLIGNAFTTGSAAEVNSDSVDEDVSAEARDKYTAILGNGKDEVTIMVYMCGTDLESRSGMATKDLSEMTRATIGENVHILVYTGGCTRWNNNIISASKNQIYEVRSGGVKCLVNDDGTGSMTDPATLSRFIRWAAKN